MNEPTSDQLTQAQFDREEQRERAREAAYDKRQAHDEASRLQLIETDVERSPTNTRDAICLLAIQGLDEAIVATMPGFTPQQAAAVVLVGRRMTYEDAAAALDVPVAELYLWSRTVPGWEREIVHWRELREVDLGMHLLNGIETLLAQPLDPATLTKVLSLLEKISQRPELRDYRRAQLSLAAEKIQLTREHMRQEAGGGDGTSPALAAQFARFRDDNLQKLLDAQQVEDGDFS